MTKRAFTLLELLVVVAIMGLLGTASVGGYRAMRRGMEERGVLQNVSQFIRNAYQRSCIDRVPVAVYMWNETRREDSDDATAIVVGRAVAVRRVGRVSRVDGQYLVDEFGDLRALRHTDEEGADDENSDYESDVGMFLYKINGDEGSFMRSTVSQTTVLRRQGCVPMLLAGQDFDRGGGDDRVQAYAYYLLDKGGITWQAGDGYGLEFAEIELPQNYTFGSYSPSIANPVEKANGTNPIRFNPLESPNNATVDIYALRPGADGSPSPQRVDRTESPTANN